MTKYAIRDKRTGEVKVIERDTAPTLGQAKDEVRPLYVNPNVSASKYHNANPDGLMKPVRGVANIARAVNRGTTDLVNTVKANPGQFASDTAKGLVVDPVKELISHPVASAQSFGGGAVKGIIGLPQSIQNFAADISDTYNNVPGRAEKLNYMQDLSNTLDNTAVARNLLEYYRKQKQLAPTLNTFGEFAGEMAVPGVAIGAASKANKINNLNKAATQLIKSATGKAPTSPAQIRAAKWLVEHPVNSTPTPVPAIAKQATTQLPNISLKAPTKPSMPQQLVNNMATGAALGALEGDGLDERAANALQVGLIGGALTGAHASLGGLAKTRPGRIARVQAKRFIKNASNIPAISQAIAGLDYAFNTDISKSANSLTKKRKEFYKLDAKSDDLGRDIGEKEHNLLERMKDLTPEEQLEIYERRRYGNREYEERKEKQREREFLNELEQKEKTTPKTNEKVQEDINSQVKNKNAKSANEQLTDKTFENVPEIDFIGDYAEQPKKSQNDFNKQIENIKNKYSSKPAEGQIKVGEEPSNKGTTMADVINNLKKSPEAPAITKNVKRVQSPTVKEALANIKRNTGKIKTDIEPEVIKLEPGTAEGADTLNVRTANYRDAQGNIVRENIFENIIKDDTKQRIKQLSEQDEQKLKDMLSKEGYEIIEDVPTNTYRLVKTTKNGKKKLVIGNELKQLRRKFRKYKQEEVDSKISDDELVKSEKETSVEDAEYADEHGYREEGDESTLKYQEGITENEVNKNYEFVDDVKDNADFQEFYKEYSRNEDTIKQINAKENKTAKDKKDILALKKEQRRLLDEAVTKADEEGKAETFLKNFKRQKEYEAEFGRAKKLGDEITDQTGLDSFEEVLDAFKTKGIEIEDATTLMEEPSSPKHSANFYKYVDSVEKSIKPYTSRNGKPFETMAGEINAKYKDAKAVQKIYDGYIDEILAKETSPSIKGELIKRANDAVDKVENSIINKYNGKYKVDYEPLTKRQYDADAEYKRVVSELKDAVEAGDISAAQKLLVENGLKGKTSKEVYELKNKNYQTSVEKGYKEIEDIGWELKTNEFGKPELTYNPEKAKEWAVNKAKTIYSKNPQKLAKELKKLENPKIVRARSEGALSEVVSRKRNIFVKDIEKGVDNREQFKYDEAKGEYVSTGDTWNRKSSNVDEAKHKTKDLFKVLSNPDKDIYAKERKDALKTAISDFVNGKDVDISKIDGKTFDGKELANMTRKFGKGSKLGDLFNNIKSDISVKIDSSSRNSNCTLKKDGNIEIIISENKAVDHEFGHAIWDDFAQNNKALYNEIIKASKASKKLLDYIGKNKDVLRKIKEYQNEINSNRKKPISQKETLKRLGKKGRSVYEKFIKYKNNYKNTMAEQYADCIKDGIFEGTPVEFKKLYSKIKPQFNKLVKDGKYEGNGEEFKKYFQKQVEKTEGTKGLSNRNSSGRNRTSGLVREPLEKSSERVKFETGDNYDEYGNVKRTMFNIDDAIIETKAEFKEATSKIQDFYDAFQYLDDYRENFLKDDLGWPEAQLKNRLLMQSEYGEGQYMMQADKGSRSIDLTRKNNTKVGFTGEKVLEGVKQKGSTQASYTRGLQDNIRIKHTQAKLEFLKKNFSEKKEGFIPVNSKLLANAMFWGKSKAWYETLTKGKDAIEKTFDKDNARKWSELRDNVNADKTDLYLPKDIYDICLTGERELAADYLATYGKQVGSKNWFKGVAKKGAALLDFYNDRFKRKVLTSATFFTNNRFGNQIMLMANSDNPMQYLKGIYDAIKTKDSDIPNEILESTLAESVRQDSMNMTKKYWSEKNNGIDNLARILNGDEIKIDNLKGLQKLGAIGVNISLSKVNDIFRKVSDFSGNVNNRMERFERKQAYSQVLSKIQKRNIIQLSNKINGTIEIAKLAKENPVLRQTVLDSVADILGDYNNFSKFERNVMKRIIPFYAWDRTIIRHAIALGKDNPVKLALIGLETYRLLNNDNDLEDYQHGAIKTNIRNKRTGGRLVINKAKYIPYTTLFEMLDSDDRVGSISPSITKVGEAVKGEKNFLHSEISSKNYKRITQDDKQGYLNIKTGEFKEGKAPLSVRAGYLAKEGYEFLYPHTRSALTSGYADLVKHYVKTGEILFPDKPYDASLGGLYHGDYAGKAGKYTKTQSAANRLDLPYQLINKYGGAGLQPEHLKERTKKYKQKHKRK